MCQSLVLTRMAVWFPFWEHMDTHHWGQQAVAQLLGSLPSVWETCIAFLASGYLGSEPVADGVPACSVCLSNKQNRKKRRMHAGGNSALSQSASSCTV